MEDYPAIPSLSSRKTFADLPIGMIFWDRSSYPPRFGMAIPRVKVSDEYAIVIGNSNFDCPISGGITYPKQGMDVVPELMMSCEVFDKLTSSYR